MNKKDLVDAIHKQTNIQKNNIESVIESFIEVTKETLKKEDRIALVGFGTFHTKERKARNGVNPKTKEKIQIPAKKYVKFIVAKSINESLN